MAVPIVGAVSGGAVNYLFMIISGNGPRHFVVRRLEKKYGTALVERTYKDLVILEPLRAFSRPKEKALSRPSDLSFRAERRSELELREFLLHCTFLQRHVIRQPSLYGG